MGVLQDTKGLVPEMRHSTLVVHLGRQQIGLDQQNHHKLGLSISYVIC